MLLSKNLGPIGAAPQSPVLELDYQGRGRTRQLVRLSDGREAKLLLPRGRPLMDGDLLEGDNGERVLVRAKAEPVVIARAGSFKELVPAAYHLGNRHVPLEIGELFLKFLPDPVIEDLALRLGLKVERTEAPFNPVTGPYHGHSHGHSHGHGHGHLHGNGNG
ncbi:MAG: urease accessory protein UreE [Deltaproteobacteria bacterium]|jgi:urease accessory protein|nr:urease accessory protein UreE [Deltaproteobacteria bacterium]